MATVRVTGGVLQIDSVPGDAHPEHPINLPDRIWGGGNEPFPTPPIVIPPDAIAPGVPAHPIYLPPSIWPSPGRPVHPIVIPPDSIWPGVPAHPIYIPVYPAHPIVIPPGAIAPGYPAHPIVLPPYEPAHPIVIPPESLPPMEGRPHPEHPIVIPDPPASGAGDWVYSHRYGWVWDPGPGGKPQPPTLPGDTSSGAAGGGQPQSGGGIAGRRGG